MTRFRLALAAALALIVGILAGAGADTAAAREEPPGLAPNNLSARTCNPSGWESVCLSWTLGTDDYTYQEVWFWQTGNTGPYSKGSQITPHSLSERTIPLLLLNQIRRSPFSNGSDSFTFQVVGVKRQAGNFDYSGFSNEVTLAIPYPGMEPAPEVPVDEEPPAEEEPTEVQPPAEAPEESDEPEEPPAQEESDAPAGKTKPSALSATQDGQAVTLNWTPGHNPNYVKQVVLRREAVRGARLEVIHTFTREAGEMDVDTYTDANVEAGKQYIYRVKALKANSKGPMTNAAKITVQ